MLRIPSSLQKSASVAKHFLFPMRKKSQLIHDGYLFMLLSFIQPKRTIRIFVNQNATL